MMAIIRVFIRDSSTLVQETDASAASNWIGAVSHDYRWCERGKPS
jgi:hypothetical protein